MEKEEVPVNIDDKKVEDPIKSVEEPTRIIEVANSPLPPEGEPDGDGGGVRLVPDCHNGEKVQPVHGLSLVTAEPDICYRGGNPLFSKGYQGHPER